MRLDEFDHNALKAKMQALINDPNTDDRIREVAKNKLQIVLKKEAEAAEKQKSVEPLKFQDFSKDSPAPGTYNAKGEFRPWNVGKSQFRPMGMGDFTKKA